MDRQAHGRTKDIKAIHRGGGPPIGGGGGIKSDTVQQGLNKYSPQCG